MEKIKLKDLKRGEWFTKKPLEFPSEKQVFTKGEYDRGSKKYSCTRFSDICDEQFIKGDAFVYVDFIF